MQRFQSWSARLAPLAGLLVAAGIAVMLLSAAVAARASAVA